MNYEINILDTPIFERKDFGGVRHYISRNDEGKIERTAVGVTSLISKSIPLNPNLEKFKMSFGSETAYWFAMDTMAYYGTILHIVAGELALGIPIMLDDESIMNWFNLNKLEKSEGGLTEYKHVSLPYQIGDKKYDFKRFRKDAIAIKQFFDDIHTFILYDDKEIEQKLELVGIETTFADFVNGYAGTIDFLFRHTVTAGEITTVMYHLFDLKTGSGHYLSHDLQLNAYANMVSEYFKNENVYMWDFHMKDYSMSTYAKYLNGKSKTAPYNLVSVEVDKETFEHYLKTYYMNNKSPDLSKKEIDFNTNIDEVIKQIKGE